MSRVDAGCMDSVVIVSLMMLVYVTAGKMLVDTLMEIEVVVSRSNVSVRRQISVAVSVGPNMLVVDVM